MPCFQCFAFHPEPEDSFMVTIETRSGVSGRAANQESDRQVNNGGKILS